ncbi:MAG: TetR/AcrR family transcriptional regulator, partial [Chloroflexi bacterium]|nr:TetR/AcrR family transcriptional regulator [Chloroflexota bacterium]
MSTAQRRAREKELRKKSILAAAKEVFFEQGITQATVDDVAERAEVSKGTIYLYFPGKESLLAHLLLEGLTLLLQDLRRTRRSCADLSAADKLRRLAQTYLRFSQRRPNYFRLIMAFDRGRFQEQIPQELGARILARSIQCLKVVSLVIEQGMTDRQFVPG